jgi:hypothetical protein
LVLIDPWEAQVGSEYLDISNCDAAGQAVNRADAVRVCEADPRARLLRGLSPAAADRFADESLDFVYVDANHAYLAVRADLRAWYPKLRPGGLLAGRCYLDGIRSGSLFGVKTAVDEFTAGLGLAVGFTTHDGPFQSWYLRKPLGSAPRPDRITLLTGYEPGFAVLGEISRPNKEAYCRRHGYRFVCRTDGFDPDRPASWSKVGFVRQELAASDWVFWTDADSLVMNAAVPLTRFVVDAVDIVLSDDPYHGINAGCFLVRNTAWARRFLDRVYARTDFLHHPWWENAAIIALYEEDPDVRRHTAVVPNKWFNAFPYEGGGYEAGDFVAHFPGVGHRETIMRNYVAMARG